MHEDRDLDPLELDRLIDGALGTYANVDSGLEQRVLARVAAAHAPARRRHWMVWTAALAAAACLLLFLLLEHRKPALAPKDNANKTLHLQPAPKANRPQEPPAAQRTNGPRRGSQPKAVTNSLAAQLPKLQVFPTPRPLSPAERALADFAMQAPDSARASLVEAQKQADAPISIAAIQIAPIQISPLDSSQPDTN
jgi:hypothetical protein